MTLLSHLQQVISGRLDKLLLELLLVVVFARRWLLFLELHDLVGEGRAGSAEELAGAPADIVSPIGVLHVLGPWNVVQQFRFQIGKVLQLLVVRMVAN